MSKSKEKQGWSILLIVASVILLGIGVYSKTSGSITGLPDDAEWILMVVLAVLIPLYRIQVTQDFSINNDIAGISTDIEKAISGGKVVYLGNAIEAAQMVVDRMRTANEVLNTYIISEPPYPEKVSKRVEQAIVDFVKREDTVFEETCSNLGKERIERLAQKSKTLPNTYRGRVLKKDFDNLPACNFIILKRSKNDPIPEEIFFGWGYFRGASNESVFWSNDDHVIGFFTGYHKALRSNEISSAYP